MLMRGEYNPTRSRGTHKLILESPLAIEDLASLTAVCLSVPAIVHQSDLTLVSGYSKLVCHQGKLLVSHSIPACLLRRVSRTPPAPRRSLPNSNTRDA
jgi:hypothetical protein